MCLFGCIIIEQRWEHRCLVKEWIVVINGSLFKGCISLQTLWLLRFYTYVSVWAFWESNMFMYCNITLEFLKYLISCRTWDVKTTQPKDLSAVWHGLTKTSLTPLVLLINVSVWRALISCGSSFFPPDNLASIFVVRNVPGFEQWVMGVLRNHCRVHLCSIFSFWRKLSCQSSCS